MKLPNKLRVWGRRGRALLLPMGNVPDHLSYLTRRTAKELGIQPKATQLLEALVRETSQETGLTLTKG
jgi:hypothetical protein